MATDPQNKPSFSALRRWGIGLNLLLRTVVVLALVVMVNYLSGRYFGRVYLSSQTRIELSPRTVNLLKSLTNDVKVTLYYDRDDPMFTTVAALLNEYHNINRCIRVATVDYLRDAGEAQKVSAAYKLSTAEEKKDVVIFDCEGRVKIVSGSALADYTLEPVPNEKEREFRRKPIAFRGEMMFTSLLLAVTNPKPLKAYFLLSHGEHDIYSKDETMGYLKFVALLQQNYIQAEPLVLLGANTIPQDCDLLVVAGPTKPIPDAELEKINHYLQQGGRLFALFNYFSVERPTGLENTLADWGVNVIADTVQDSDNTTTLKGSDVAVFNFSQHPVVNPIIGSALHLILPRPVAALEHRNQSADAPRVQELAFSGPHAVLAGSSVRKSQRYPLAVAVEQGAVKGVVTERGTTRMVVVGDSIFLANHQIDSAANRDFAGYAVNWLLDRTQLLQGLGPRPVTEFRLVMTKSQLKSVQWLLLGALPGAVFALGGLVWLRRRK